MRSELTTQSDTVTTFDPSIHFTKTLPFDWNYAHARALAKFQSTPISANAKEGKKMRPLKGPLAALNNRSFDRYPGAEFEAPEAATRSHTKEFRLEGLALINARKIPGVSDTEAKEGRVPFSHVCTPRDSTSTSLHDPLPLPRLLRPVISASLTPRSLADAPFKISWPPSRRSRRGGPNVTPHDVCIAWRHTTMCPEIPPVT